ncbi:MAG: aspartate aminotransferase, partial [Planctomycetaceae bacterium]|nr:aspartate aminotransferase [Planctomycetaceae bacterium]
MHLSQAVQTLKPSATIAAATKAKELKQQGIKVYDFTLGEPDFNTPQHIRDAAIEAMNAGHTHYTPAGGIPQLKQAIC